MRDIRVGAEIINAFFLSALCATPFRRRVSESLCGALWGVYDRLRHGLGGICATEDNSDIDDKKRDTVRDEPLLAVGIPMLEGKSTGGFVAE